MTVFVGLKPWWILLGVASLQWGTYFGSSPVRFDHVYHGLTVGHSLRSPGDAVRSVTAPPGTARLTIRLPCLHSLCGVLYPQHNHTLFLGLCGPSIWRAEYPTGHHSQHHQRTAHLLFGRTNQSLVRDDPRTNLGRVGRRGVDRVGHEHRHALVHVVYLFLFPLGISFFCG